MDQLISNSKRQAIHALKGYSYQIWQSVLHWIDLQENEHLYLEGAEDIDLHFTDRVETAQIKETADSGPVTLRSNDVIEAINHFWEHQENNPKIYVTFRFLTTAERGFEKPNPFNKMRGLDLWDACKNPETDCARLKKFLVATKKLSPDLRKFIKNSDKETLKEKLLDRIFWDTGNKKQDSIEKDIERKIIEYGDGTYRLPPFESKKIIPHLLKYAWETARQNENRRLTRSDFLNIFEAQTTVLVTRNEFIKLQRKISKFPPQVFNHYGVPQQQFEIQQSHEPVFEPILPVEPNRLAGRSLLIEKLQNLLKEGWLVTLTGSTGMGKSTISHQIAASTESNWRKISLRDNQPDEIKKRLNIAYSLIETETEPVNCILDDLNFDKATTVYENSLIRLLSAVKSRGGRVVITSQNSIPSRIEDICSIPKNNLIAVPPLDESEIRELALKYGCPAGKALHSWSLIVATQTLGHPQLVHAQIRGLQYNNWKNPEIADIFSNQEINNVRQEQRQNLTDSLPEEARELLYRLSIFAHRFNRRQALFISEKKSEVSRPGEYLDLLIGPWIEPLGKTHFLVSPLVKNAAAEVFSPKKVKRLHSAAAMFYLKEKIIDSSDISSILMHGLAGENPFPLMVLVPNVLGIAQEHKRSVYESISWFGFVKTGETESFFPNFTLVNHMLRSLQFAILAETDPDKASPVIFRWEREISEQNDSLGISGTKEQMLFQFLSDVILDFRVRLDLTQVGNWLLQLIALLKNTEKFYPDHPNAEANFRNSIKPFDRLDIYVRFAAKRCKTKWDVIKLLTALEKSGDDASREVFSILDEKIDLATSLVDTIWLEDVAKDSPQWEICLTMLEWVSGFAERNHVEALTAAAYVARSVIYEEYLKEPEKAFDMLSKGESSVGYAHTFLQNYRARLFIFRDRYQEALDLLRPVFEYYETQKYSGRFVAYRDATICAAHLGDWKEAAKFAYQGKKSFEDYDPDFSLDPDGRINNESLAATFQADYAFALWKAGEKAGAVNEFARIFDFLEQMSPSEDNIRMRMLRERVCHTVIWMAGDETKVPNNVNEPQPGFFSDFTLSEEVKNTPAETLAHVWGLLASLEYRMKTGTKIFNRLEKISKVGKSPTFDTLSKMFRLKYAIRNFEAENIINLFIEYANDLKGDFYINGKMPVKPNWDETTSLKHLIFTFLTISVSRYETWQVPDEQWVESLSGHRLFSAEIQTWLKDIEEITALDISTLRNLVKNSDALPDRKILAALRLSALKQLDPETRLYANLLLLLTNFIYTWRDEIEDAVEELIASSWQHTVEMQRFALNMPNLTEKEVAAACADTQRTGISKAAAILLAAAKGVNLKIGSETLESLRILATR